MKRDEIIEINRKLGSEFATDSGPAGNISNLDYALSLDDPYRIAQEILRGHPFLDGNKRTSLMVYLMLTSRRPYEDILTDYHDLFLALSKI